MCMWILSGYKKLISFTINTINQDLGTELAFCASAVYLCCSTAAFVNNCHGEGGPSRYFKCHIFITPSDPPHFISNLLELKEDSTVKQVHAFEAAKGLVALAIFLIIVICFTAPDHFSLQILASARN